MRKVLKIPNGRIKMEEAGVSLLALGQAHPCAQDPAPAVFLSPEDACVTWQKWDAAEAEIPKILWPQISQPICLRGLPGAANLPLP